MTRFAKLPPALLAALAMLLLAVMFLSPGSARADDATGATASSAATTSTSASTPTESSAPATSTESQQHAAVVSGAGDLIPGPCTGPQDLPDCVLPDCTALPDNPLCTTPPPVCDVQHPDACVPCDSDAFKELPICQPPKACEKISDLPNCTPSCAFIAQLLGQTDCTPPQCVDISTLPQQIQDAIQQLPQQIRDGLKICPSNGGGGGGTGGGTPPPPVTQPVGNHPSVFYANCDAARQAGAAPINRDAPGYRPALDSDSDGIACEDETAHAAPVSNTGQLAYTGAVPSPVALAGFGLVLGGAGLLRLSRRPR